MEQTMIPLADQAPIQLDRVAAFLATRPPLDVAQELRNRLAALCAYHQISVDQYNQAYEARLRTDRYIGQLLAVMPKRHGKLKQGHATPLLADIGITKSQSQDYQAIARVPEQDFNAYIQDRKDAGERIVRSDILDPGPIPFDAEAEYISTMKPKTNRAGDPDEPAAFDVCQTPPEAIDPLLPYLPPGSIVWECACGEHSLVDAFYDAGMHVIATDIKNGVNFFEFEPAERYDYIITNPPYSIKYQWLERCYQLGHPFALLLPVETLGARRAQLLFMRYGVQLLLLDRRINFKMPRIGWDGSSAQFPVAWFTWGMRLETQIVFGRLP